MTPGPIEYTIYANGPTVRVTFTAEAGNKAALNMSVAEARKFAAELTEALRPRRWWRRRA